VKPKNSRAAKPKTAKVTKPKTAKVATSKTSKTAKATKPKAAKATASKTAKATKSKAAKATASKAAKATASKTAKATKSKTVKDRKSKTAKAGTSKSSRAAKPKAAKATKAKRARAGKPEPAEAAKPKKTGRPTPARSPDAIEIGRDLASLAVIRAEQGGQLSVRQREQIRRALLKASVSLEWDTLAAGSDEPIKKATKEVTKLAKKGTQAIREDLAEELAAKKTEVTRLKKAAVSMQKLAEAGDFSDPIEVSYNYTARDGSQGYLTKTQTVTLTTVKEAQDAATSIEKKIEGWDKLREQMLLDIKRRQKHLEEIDAELSTFVDSTSTLLLEVFATLH